MITTLEFRLSVRLKVLIEDAVETLSSFAGKWNQIKQLGIEEGFTVKELQDMIRPLLKEKLTNNQIRYLLNVEEYKDRNREQYAKSKSANNYPIVHNNDIEQSKNDHGNEGTRSPVFLEPEPLYTMVKSTSGLEGTVELDPATDVMNKLQELTRDNENLRKELHDEREILAKQSITTADKQDANMDQLFDMLPNDDKTTYKMKKGGITTFGRRYLDFRSRGVKTLTWWIREE